MTHIIPLWEMNTDEKIYEDKKVFLIFLLDFLFSSVFSVLSAFSVVKVLN